MSEKDNVLKKAGKGFLGMFVEVNETEDDSKPTSIQSNNNPPRPISVAAPYSSVPASVSPQLDQNELDKFIKHFEDLFNNANLPGPDYYEFDKMSTAMGSLDENVRIPAAFSGLAVQGLTKEKLISTGKQYIAIIEQDQKNFQSTVNTVASKDIQLKKDTVVSLTQRVADNEDLIEKLKNDILKDKEQASK